MIIYVGFNILKKTGVFLKINENCYEVEEPYVVQIPYTYTYKYSIIDSNLEKSFSLELGEYTIGNVKVANLEDKGGVFTLNCEFEGVDKKTSTKISKYIRGHFTETFQCIYDNKAGEDIKMYYTLEPPTETRYKEEVRYKKVQRCQDQNYIVITKEHKEVTTDIDCLAQNFDLFTQCKYNSETKEISFILENKGARDVTLDSLYVFYPENTLKQFKLSLKLPANQLMPFNQSGIDPGFIKFSLTTNCPNLYKEFQCV
jgi:hypothetical protein